MYETKLLRLMKRMDGPALRRFGAYLQRPFCKASERERQLFEYIAACHPSYDQKKLRREAVLRKLYEGAGQEALGKMRKDQTSLTKLLKAFLMQEALDRQPLRQQELLLDAYEQWGMGEEFLSAADQQLAAAREAGLDAASLRFMAELHQRLFFHPATEKYSAEAPHLYAAIGYLEQYYLLSKCRLLADALHRKRVYGSGPDELFVAELLPLARRHAEVPALSLYVQLLEILDGQTPDLQFEPLVAALEEQVDQLSAVDKRNISAKLMYLGYYYYEKGQLDYVPAMVRIAKLADAKGFVTYQNAITPALFVTIINMAAINGDFAWSEYFSRKYAPFLLDTHREAAVQLGESYLLFYRGHFKAALKHASDVAKVHPGNRVQAETLFLRLYCELIAAGEDYWEEFELCADRFDKYVRDRAFFSPHKRAALLTFIQLASGLARYHSTLDRAERRALNTRLAERLRQAGAVYSAHWLRQKIQGLP